VQNFQKFIVAEGRKGFSPERLGEAVHLALSTAKPNARYAVIKQRFKNCVSNHFRRRYSPSSSWLPSAGYLVVAGSWHAHFN
jgi:hypothetical protein